MREIIKKTILEYLKTTDAHPTAREIFAVIEAELGATNKDLFLEELDLLEKAHEIGYVLSADNVKHYDIKPYKHYHFICKNCGVVRDINFNYGAAQLIIDHAQRLINSFAKITEVIMGFQGICHDCRKKNPNTDS